MAESKMLKEFIESQYGLMHEMREKAVVPPLRGVMKLKGKEKPGDTESPEEEMEYIIAKKPGAKRVAKFLQSMIDEIAAENDL
jgi:hypothetical protein